MEDRSFSVLLKELLTAFSGLVRSEIRLAKVEMTENAKVVGKNAGKIGIFAVLAWLGTLSFVAFLIIGIGELLEGRYWLSALLVSLAFLIPSALAIMKAARALREETGFNQIKQNVQSDRAMIQERVEGLKAAPHTAASSEPGLTTPSMAPMAPMTLATRVSEERILEVNA